MESRFTIALLVSGIMDDFTSAVCHGVKAKAEAEGHNLVVLPGKYLNRDLSNDPDIQYEYQYNMLYSVIRKNSVDALVISAGDIGCMTTEEKLCEMLKQYEGIPSVLIASKVKGYTNVCYDNEKGIRDALTYLIHEKNCRRICMIGGIETNSDIYERKQVFLKTLKENNIPFESRNYVEGNLTRFCDHQFAKLLDDNPDMDAVFCVNDDTAIGFYEEMRKRGLQPGRDIYVFGYDNIMAAAKAKPALSSVWADPFALGECAVSTVIRKLKGEQVENVIMPTWLIKRDSLGEAGIGNIENIEALFDKQAVLSAFQNIFYRHAQENRNIEIAAIRNQFVAVMDKLFLMMKKARFEEKEKKDLLDEFEQFFNNSMLEYADVGNLRYYFKQINSVIRYDSRQDPSDQKAAAKALSLMELFDEIYNRMITAMDNRFAVMRRKEQEGSYFLKLFVRNILQFEKGNDQSYAVLLKNLDWLDIRNASVSLFKNPIIHLDGEQLELPTRLDLKAFLRNGTAQTVPAVYQDRRMDDIFKYEDEDKEQHSTIMMPLFSNETLYGLLMCDLTEKVFDEYEFLTYQINAAVKMIELLKSNEMIQRQLEGNLVTLRENNIELDNMSKMDVLTGIFNRRGFFDSAEECIKKCRENDKDVFVAYVDMDNLKIINDRYGHEEGDSSLKTIGGILRDIVRKNGIVGRIGGDEFAFVMETGATEKVAEQIKEKFDEYNQNSDKPYNLTVSVGIYDLKASEDMSLQEALAFADEKLYDAKQHRIKQVAKKESN